MSDGDASGDSPTGDGSDAPGRSGADEYIAAIQSVDASLDRVVMANDIDRETDKRLADVVETFGSWDGALEAAGIDVQEQICEELLRLNRELGHPPSPQDVNEHGHVSATMVRKQFESFESAVERATARPQSRSRRELFDGRCRQGLAAVVTLWRATRISARAVSERVRNDLESVTHDVRPTDRLGRDRRKFLKYATLSLSLAAASSSSDGLFESDTFPAGTDDFGYGGTPLNDTTQRDSGGSGSTDRNDTPSEGSVTDGKEPSTAESGGMSRLSNSDKETETSQAGAAGANGVTEAGTESGDTPTDTETESPSEADRYADVQETSQDYGEQGYGGVATT
jgi:hypothetical protein